MSITTTAELSYKHHPTKAMSSLSSDHIPTLHTAVQSYKVHIDIHNNLCVCVTPMTQIKSNLYDSRADRVAQWRSGRALDLRSLGRGFVSWVRLSLEQNCVATFGKLSHLCASVTKQYNLVLVEKRCRSSARKVTASLEESNGSLPLE